MDILRFHEHVVEKARVLATRLPHVASQLIIPSSRGFRSYLLAFDTDDERSDAIAKILDLQKPLVASIIFESDSVFPRCIKVKSFSGQEEYCSELIIENRRVIERKELTSSC